MLQTAIESEGYAIIPSLLTTQDVAQMIEAFDQANMASGRAGARHILKFPPVAVLAVRPLLLDIAKQVLGETAFPFRATLFDKSKDANWLVSWHQDTALPFLQRRDMPGWGPWSNKSGVAYANAPMHALDKILALRVQLDESTNLNGSLRVLPGTHRLGVLGDEEVSKLAATTQPTECPVPSGGVLAMRPLLIHASSKMEGSLRRRVLHIEYAGCSRFDGELELAVC